MTRDDILSGRPHTEIFYEEIASGRCQSNADLAHAVVEILPELNSETIARIKSLIWQWDRLETGRMLSDTTVNFNLVRLLQEAGFQVGSGAPDL